MAKATIRYPGVYIEETRSSVKVIPGVGGSTGSKTSPGKLLASGYKVVEADIGSGGVALLLGKGSDLVLVRMSEYREGSSVEGQLVVTFVRRIP